MLDHRLISIQMPVYMSSLMNAGKHIYTTTLCVCVCVCVCAYPRVEFSSRLILKPYLLIKRRYCRVERTTKRTGLRSLAYINTHTQTGLLCIYVYQHLFITTCRPASVLILIYVLDHFFCSRLEIKNSRV